MLECCQYGQGCGKIGLTGIPESQRLPARKAATMVAVCVVPRVMVTRLKNMISWGFFICTTKLTMLNTKI